MRTPRPDFALDQALLALDQLERQRERQEHELSKLGSPRRELISLSARSRAPKRWLTPLVSNESPAGVELEGIRSPRVTAQPHAALALMPRDEFIALFRSLRAQTPKSLQLPKPLPAIQNLLCLDASGHPRSPNAPRGEGASPRSRFALVRKPSAPTDKADGVDAANEISDMKDDSNANVHEEDQPQSMDFANSFRKPNSQSSRRSRSWSSSTAIESEAEKSEAESAGVHRASALTNAPEESAEESAEESDDESEIFFKRYESKPPTAKAPEKPPSRVRSALDYEYADTNLEVWPSGTGTGVRATPSAGAKPATAGSQELWPPSSATSQMIRVRTASKEDLKEHGGQPPQTATAATEVDDNPMDFDEAEIDTLRKVRPFARYTEYKLREIRKASTIRQFARYSTIFREGTKCNSLVVVMKGRVSAQCNRRAGALLDPIIYGPSAYFGLEAIAYGEMRRDCTLQVVDDCEVLVLEAMNLRGLNLRIAELRVSVTRALLQEVAYLQGLAPLQYNYIAPMMEIVYDDADGSALFEQGSPSDAFYILLDGRVGLYARDKKWSRKLCKYVELAETLRNECLPGGEDPWFGDTAFHGSSAPRDRTARCLEPSKLLVIKTKVLNNFVFRAHLSESPRFDELIETQRLARERISALQDGGEDTVF